MITHEFRRSEPPQEALDFFREKGFKIGFSYLDVWREEHEAAFTVAKAMDIDLLSLIREKVDAALAEGWTFARFQKELRPLLITAGWWGSDVMIDPQTGEELPVELGTPRRLKIIYDTNLRVARSVGQWQRIQRTKDVLPYLLYMHGPSREPRPEHLSWHGTCLPVSDAWWTTHYPPSAWGCKCRVRQITKTEYQRLQREGIPASGAHDVTGRLTRDRIPVQTVAPETKWVTFKNPRTGEEEYLPEGVDPGWDWNPGASRLARLEKILAEKKVYLSDL